MDVDRTIRVAESLLPGDGPITLESDPRWVALLSVRPFVAEEPEAVWEFVSRYGCYTSESVRHGVAVCLLQDLLALHFEVYFQKVVRLVRENKKFADTFARCAKYGQGEAPGNGEAFDHLLGFAQNYRR
jgi:hypothetical protein